MSLAREIWDILTPPQRRRVVGMQLVSLAMAFSTVSGIAAIAPFFAVLAEPGLIERNELLSWLYVHGGFASERAFVVALGVGFIGVMLTANLINVLGMLALHRLLLRIGTELRTSLLGEYLSRPYAFHAATNSTTLFNNIVYETTRVTYGLLQYAFVLVTSLLTAGFIVLSILLLRPIVAVAMVVGLAGGYLLIYLLMRNRLLNIGQTQSRFAREETQIVNESLGGIREITILQAQAFFLRRSEHAGHGFLRALAHSQLVAQSPRNIMECVAAACLVGLALVLGVRAGGIGPWLGSLTFLGFAAYRLLPTLQQAFAAIVKIRADRGALALVAPDLRRTRAQRTTPHTDGAPFDAAWIERPQRAIELNDVSYRYAPDRSWALREVSLRIPCRAAVGIVGANGAGKSTLVDLVAGLLTPTAGTVEIDGCILDDSSRAAWQTRIAYVPQQIFLFDASIAENIAVGMAADAIDERRLHDAVRLAQLDEFATSLPRGLHQRIGERGVAVSGGQRQRIGIARALYRNAPVLLLDEATNSLDGLTERELVTTLGRLRGRCTIVLIAHRMSTVRACDLIFHLDEGRIIGSGTYEGLLQSSDGFRRMTGLR